MVAWAADHRCSARGCDQPGIRHVAGFPWCRDHARTARARLLRLLFSPTPTR